jgi:hypothetical protein
MFSVQALTPVMWKEVNIKGIKGKATLKIK